MRVKGKAGYKKHAKIFKLAVQIQLSLTVKLCNHVTDVHKAAVLTVPKTFAYNTESHTAQRCLSSAFEEDFFASVTSLDTALIRNLSFPAKLTTQFGL